jgi:chorismate mutase
VTELRVKGIRGAISVPANTKEAILSAAKELTAQIMAANSLDKGDIISIIYTVTPDLNAEFPAKGARELGLTDVALMCAQEIPVPGALPRCLRVLIHAHGDDQPPKHIYLGQARQLRPDWGNDNVAGD